MTVYNSRMERESYLLSKTGRSDFLFPTFQVPRPSFARSTRERPLRSHSSDRTRPLAYAPPLSSVTQVPARTLSWRLPKVRPPPKHARDFARPHSARGRVRDATRGLLRKSRGVCSRKDPSRRGARAGTHARSGGPTPRVCLGESHRGGRASRGWHVDPPRAPGRTPDPQRATYKPSLRRRKNVTRDAFLLVSGPSPRARADVLNASPPP